MKILDNTLIICCIIGAFIAGIRLSGYYHNRIMNEVNLALQKQYVRLQAGSDADDPCQPYVNAQPYLKQRIQLPPEFDNRLKTNGQATMMVGNSNSKKQQR